MIGKKTNLVACMLIVCMALSTLSSAGVLREIWNGGRGIEEAIELADSGTPADQVDILPDPTWVDIADNYSARMTGWLTVPETGEYTLYLAGDDYQRLWVSQDDDPANAVEVARVDGWTSSQEWTKYDTQKAEPMMLTEGQVLAFVGIMQEGGGGDGQDWGWIAPGSEEIVVIPGEHFSHPYEKLALSPSPADGATDLIDVVASWTAPAIGEAPVYNFYAGTDPEALALVAEGLTGTSLTVGTAGVDLDLETTYYWRVDADGEEGLVWSFTTEPVAFPVEGIIATTNATSGADGGTADQTVDGSGLDENDGHSTQSMDMWLGTPPAGEPVTITYEFPRVYKMDEMLVWNSNTGFEAFLGYGFKDVTVEISVDGEAWTVLADVEFAQAPGTEAYAANTVVDMMGVAAKYVKLTANSNWGGAFPDAGLSEVRFMYIPAQARIIAPAEGETLVVVPATLEWYSGRDAVSSDIYIGRDRDLVEAGDASTFLGTVEGAREIVTGQLLGDFEYFWKVNENDGTDVWDGDIWSFTTFPDVTTAPEAWLGIATMADPGYLATDVVNGAYDIGEFGGEMTYEFLVRSNPAETQASMALIGRLGFGDTTVGLKYEQWNNTGTYGATAFGVADYDFGVANDPGVPTHLVFVSSEEAGTTTLFVNGAEMASIDAAMTLSGKVGIGRAIREDESVIDDFDGEIMGVAIYDRVLSSGQIRINADTFFALGARDVTAPGDQVVGEPDDGDWPGAEHPALAVDDNTGTKYLHFKGGSQPTGIRVAPAIGATIVTGLTFTTANDDYGRDPTSFEISGSNESIDGPYEVIATGAIEDFAGEELWPRFTQTETPITFENGTAYKYYKVMFPTVDRANNDGLMQIAEIELIGRPAVDLYVEDFESYEVGTDLHNVDGWEGWEGTASAGAPVSDAFASSGSNSLEAIGSADVVGVVGVTGGAVTLTVQQYIPSGTSGETYFILMSQYAPNPLAWSSVGPAFNLGTGQIGGDQGTIVYDQWVELKFEIDLDGNTVDSYYNGELLSSGQWSDAGHNTLQGIDLWANNASSIYYDDVVISTK